MSDLVKSVAKLSQTVISQFFSPVSGDEARTANAEAGSRVDSNTSQSESNPTNQEWRVGNRLRGNLKIFQLNTAKKTESGSALSRLMGDCTNSLAFITEPPFFHGRVCGFSNIAFNILHHNNNKKRCRAAIIASKGVALCPLLAYTDEDTLSMFYKQRSKKLTSL